MKSIILPAIVSFLISIWSLAGISEKLKTEESQPIRVSAKTDEKLAETATYYRISFLGNFTKQNHPVLSFPFNPHFSPMVIANHNSKYAMFPQGTLATTGVKNVSETGSTTRLQKELKNSPYVENYKTTSNTSGTGLITTTIKVSKDHPILSIISMIAPSPDWFVGASFSVLKGKNFIKYREFSLYAMDAGTDKGKEFSSSDEPNEVPEFIHLLTNVSGISIGNPFGTLFIEKI